MSNTSKIDRFRALVSGDPDNPLHSYALAQALLAAGEYEQGAEAFGRCLELDPGWMMAAIRRGACLVSIERWDEARQALELGRRLAEEQNHDEPFDEIRDLLDQLPDA